MTTKEFAGNRGEWSELYALLRVLADGQLSLGDPQMRTLRDGRRMVTAVFREELTTTICHRVEADRVVSRSANGVILADSPRDDFVTASRCLLGVIQTTRSGQPSCPSAESLARKHGLTGLKAGADKKVDLYIELLDPRSGTAQRVGFSVKSDLGSKPSLLNASSATNFIYQLKNLIDPSVVLELNAFEGKDRLRRRLQSLRDSGVELVFSDVEGGIFMLNMQVIDSRLPEIAAEMLRMYYAGEATTLQECVNALEVTNPLDFNQSQGHHFYDYKVQQFLRDIALGMRPQSTIWSGRYEASAGYVVVRADGNLVAYSLYNLNEFQEFLLLNTRFDTPSLDRHKAGVIAGEPYSYTIKLPMQIRFN